MLSRCQMLVVDFFLNIFLVSRQYHERKTMQALGTKRVVTAPRVKELGGTRSEKAACKLSFYTDYPKDAIAIDDFEQYAIDRLQGT